MRPIPINDAEAIFEPFWDPEISTFPQWQVESGLGANASLEQYWCYILTRWDSGQAGQPAFRMRRALKVPLQGYDTLVLSMCAAKGARITLRAEVDGHWMTPIADALGNSESWEYTGPLPGEILTGLEIEVTAGLPGVGSGWLNWIGLAHAARLEGMLAREANPPYSSDWHDYLVPEGQTLGFSPALGLFFGGEDLAAIRQRATRPGYTTAMAWIRATAHTACQMVPEKRIRQFNPTCGLFTRVRDRQPEMYTPATVCAFVGLVDRDPQMLRMAARYALSLAHMDRWCESPQEIFPGSRWDQRSFRETLTTDACASVLDWAGEVLTPLGRDVIREAIAMKGLPRIQLDYLKYEYIHHMNQAIWFSRGRMLGLLAMTKEWPRTADYLEIALRDLQGVVSDTLLDDGSHGEPPGYFFCHGMFGMPAFAALARHRGCAVSDLVPARLKKSVDFICALSSTAPRGRVLPIGDSGDLMDFETAALFARYLGDPRWTRLLHDRLALLADPPPGDTHAGQMSSFGGGATVIALGPDEDPPDTEVVPTFHVFPNAGMLVSCRPSQGGVVRVQLLGAPENCGHAHEDKGSFILEAYGDALALDRGIGSYYDARATLSKYATAHNTLTPIPADGSEPHQVSPAPQPIRPEGQGDRRALYASVDTTSAWGGQFVRHVRRIRSDVPEVIAVEDEAELPQAGAVAWHLHSLYPIRVEGRAIVVEGEHAALRIEPDWAFTVARCAEDGATGGGLPVYHLELRSVSCLAHKLVTTLRITLR